MIPVDLLNTQLLEHNLPYLLQIDLSNPADHLADHLIFSSDPYVTESEFADLPIPNYMQNTKEIDFSTTAAKLRFCSIFTEGCS